MKLCGAVTHSEIAGGRVHLKSPASIAAVLLGIQPLPPWRDLQRAGPIDLAAEIDDEIESKLIAPFTRDFGDSIVECASGAQATAQVLESHPQPKVVRLPTAFAFAFAQQWARLGCACVHGAMLKFQETGILVLGARASGKSVLSASCLAAGGGIVTDDYLLLGQREEAVFGERIRQFLSLRRSWAGESLATTADADWGVGATGNRSFLRVPDDDSRFPTLSRIDRIWVLRRPRAGRQQHSSLQPINQAEVYAAIVAAIQPLLLGAEFPHERALLQSLVGRLMASTSAARLETGQDIVLAPRQTWDRLLTDANSRNFASPGG